MSKSFHAAPAPVKALLGAMAVSVVGYTLLLVTGTGGPATGRWGLTSIVFLSAACIGWRAVRRSQDRVAWACIALAAATWAGAETIYDLVLVNDKTPPVPSAADVMWLAYYPLTAAGLALLVRSRVGRVPRVYWLDALLGVAAVGAVLGVITSGLIAAAAEGVGLTALLINATYPVGDLVLLMLVIGAIILGGFRLSWAWLMIAVSQAGSFVSDTAFLTLTSSGAWYDGNPFALGWAAGAALLAFASWMPDGEVLRDRERSQWTALVTPAVSASLALGALVWDHFQRLPDVSLVLATVAVALLIVRLIVAFRENFALVDLKHREATTDALTELRNRRALMADLDKAAAPEEPDSVLVLFDLNGFKAYNDNFGHPAGDALLGRVGTRLGEVADGLAGRAYRLGGDEFCVLVPLAEHTPRDVAQRAGAALREHGEGFSIDAAWGMCRLPCAGGAPAALRDADRAMYELKARSRPSAAQQSLEVLLAAIRERNPQLGEHSHGVADVAVRVAHRLNCAAHEAETVRLAAELHDIGKIAIPDEVLCKPGPLDEQEWAFMRRHTLIGERILLAARDLQTVAPLVRSSHERWDGKGYPDGLAGQDIPLGARILSVCDSFDAMTEQRPYSKPRTFADALAEVQRCAGTQFDPVVVRAFVAVLREQEQGPVASLVAA